MKEVGLLVPSGIAVWTGSRIVLRAEAYRNEQVGLDNPIARVPLWAVRALGIFVTIAGLWVFYEFLIS